MFVSTLLLSANKTSMSSVQSISVKIQVKIEESERGWQSPGVWLEPLASALPLSRDSWTLCSTYTRL